MAVLKSLVAYEHRKDYCTVVCVIIGLIYSHYAELRVSVGTFWPARLDAGLMESKRLIRGEFTEHTTETIAAKAAITTVGHALDGYREEVGLELESAASDGISITTVWTRIIRLTYA